MPALEESWSNRVRWKEKSGQRECSSFGMRLSDCSCRCRRQQGIKSHNTPRGSHARTPSPGTYPGTVSDAVAVHERAVSGGVGVDVDEGVQTSAGIRKVLPPAHDTVTDNAATPALTNTHHTFISNALVAEISRWAQSDGCSQWRFRSSPR